MASQGRIAIPQGRGAPWRRILHRAASLLRVTDASPARATVTAPSSVQIFNLSRQFAVVGFLVVAAVSLVVSILLARFIAHEMLYQDAREAMAFVQASTAHNNAEAYFTKSSNAGVSRLQVESYLQSIAGLPDVIRAQVYSASGEILWSHDSRGVSRSFEGNPELDKALRGELAVEADILESRKYIKPEHVFALLQDRQFAEYYIPIWNSRRDAVIGVVEIYKSPDSLFRVINSGLRLIWVCALFSAVAIYGSLFWVVRRGQRLIEQQQNQIANNEAFAAVGEIVASVAHNIRNPLAAIRSSAELLSLDRGRAPSDAPDFARDIMTEADRLESWVHGLLRYAKTGEGAPRPLAANKAVEEQLWAVEERMKNRGIHVARRLAPNLPVIWVEDVLVGQVVRTIINNAVDAMPQGGTLELSSRATEPSASRPAGIEIVISDTGVGIAEEKLEKTFLSPASTKADGMGIGLPLVARALRRVGGTVTLESAPGDGTCVTLFLPRTSDERLRS